jgi:hypothetical protein
MAVTDVVKDYLVSLNLKVNKSQYSEFTGKIKELDKLTENITNKTAKNVASATVMVAGFLATVTGGIAGFLDGLADSDMETEKFAKRMWMTEDAARSLRTTLNAMGEDMGSITDIAMNSELRGYFTQLQTEASKIAAPAELQAKLQKIREIKFEFMRFRLIVSYGSQWVGYYLTKYLEEPMARIKATLKGTNDYLENNIAKVAQKVAKNMMKVLNVVLMLVDNFLTLKKGADDFWASLDSGQKKVAGVAGLAAILPIAIKLISILSPVKKIALVIYAVLALITDFMNYNKGGKSPLGPLYDEINKVFGDKELIASFKEALEEVSIIMGELYDSYKTIDAEFKDATGMSILEAGLRTVKNFLLTILDTITLIGKIIGPWISLMNAVEKWKMDGKSGFLGAGGWGTDSKTGYITYDPAKASAHSTTTNNQKSNVVNGGINPTYTIYGSNATAIAKNVNDTNTILMNRIMNPLH